MQRGMVCNRSKDAACTASGLAHRALFQHRCERILDAGVDVDDLLGQVANSIVLLCSDCIVAVSVGWRRDS